MWGVSPTNSIGRKRVVTFARARDFSLAIARGFVEPLHGTNRIDRIGTAMTITLPIPIGTKTLDTAA